jgi:hypothetical protein
MGLSGYWLGDTIHRLTGPVGISVAVLTGLLSLALLLFVHRHQRRLEEEAERVLPGPWDAYWKVRRGQRPSRPRAFRMPGRREHAHPRERERSGEARTTMQVDVMGDHVGQAFTQRHRLVSMPPRTSGAECHAARNTVVHKITLIPVPKETVVHE